MEKINITYRTSAESYINDLVDILFEEEYFGFKSSAQNYAVKIVDFIEDNITTFPSRRTPIELSSFGSNYIFYKSNKRTTWYIFFERTENNYLITNIINSHCKEAKWL
ncbi:hypothetical protein FNW52_03100 [Flavobacterium sp. ZT3R18]|uniref:hypothetical protein n=1 Tax=Flavobacterium sp. ZT3R18 TaxID=2594429 RepID=UPI001179E4D6|nr:hypothetical protein [Flavobacterium sp. ZT3R18]TRX37903.1 hypothetical protein FNW52_03100 [Flavobacterium sp. ZT3R18]